jgi:lysozyme family protein
MNLVAIKQECERLWPTAKIVPSRLKEVNAVAARLVAPAAKARYLEIEKATGVPWYIVAIIHEREASQNFSCQLGQGDRLNEVSRHTPRGMGPYYDHPNDPPLQDAFYRCAVDVLFNSAPFAAKWKDWTIGGALTLTVTFNGIGYETYHHECSPYDWGATTVEEEGKYSSDGKYSPSMWDTQVGCAAMLKQMMVLDPSIKFADEPVPPAAA